MPTLLRPWLALGAAAVCLIGALAARPAPAQGNCAVSAEDLALSPEEAQVFQYTNEFRAQNGLPALKPNAAAMRTAAWHARDMATRGYYGHNPPDSTWYSMTLSCGMGRVSGENIAAGYPTARSVVLDGYGGYPGWAYHEGHRENILSQNGALWRSMGAGFVRGGPYGTYWVQEFSTEAPDDEATATATATAIPTATATPMPTPTPTPTPACAGTAIGDWCLAVVALPGSSLTVRRFTHATVPGAWWAFVGPDGQQLSGYVYCSAPPEACRIP